MMIRYESDLYMYVYMYTRMNCRISSPILFVKILKGGVVRLMMW